MALAWLVGSNLRLGEDVPLLYVQQQRTREVIGAAEAFVDDIHAARPRPSPRAPAGSPGSVSCLGGQPAFRVAKERYGALSALANTIVGQVTKYPGPATPILTGV